MFLLWTTYRNEGKKTCLPMTANWLGQVGVSETDCALRVSASGGEWSIEPPQGFRWDDGSAGPRAMEDCRQYAMQGNGRPLTVFASRYEKEDTAFVKLYLPQNGRVSVGALPDQMIRYAAPTVSRTHGELILQQGRPCVYVDHSSFGSYINGAPYHNASRELRFGDVVTILPALQIVYMGTCIAVNNARRIVISPQLTPVTLRELAVEPAQAYVPAVVEYQRSPRHMQKPNTEPVEIEPPLEKERRKELPTWLAVGPSMTMVLPMMVSSLVTGRSLISSLAMMGTASLLSVMWGAFNRRYQKEQSILTEEDRQRICKQYYAEIEEMLAAETERERKRLMHDYLSVNECLHLPALGERRLWERMPSHEDFLCVRLGLGEQEFPMPLNVTKNKISLVDDPLRREPQRLYDQYHIMHDVPKLLNLSEHEIIGVLGSKAAPWLLQSIVVQVAAMHSYHDVRIAVIHDETDEEQWRFAKWLPHAYASDDRTLRMVVSQESAVGEVFSHLDSVISVRADQKSTDEQDEEKQAALCIPWYVVVCTDPKLLEDRSIVRYLTTPGLGFTLILQTPAMESLPKECKLIIESREELGAVYHTDGEVEGVRFETTDENQLGGFAQQIAPFRIKEIVENSEIPSLVTFLETYNVRRVEELDIRRFWNENHAYQSVKTVLGYKAGNAPFVLDISFKNHGPHGLIAGTTGAGKSVLLQSFILSLSINYSPKEVQFILIDYKGGGTSEDFRSLPHAAGIIDSLQGERMIYRALASIKGEILRREQLFKEGGVNDIDDYMKLYNNDPAEEPLGHLIIIVDEFAELRKEQPEFMTELVSAARVGRSLGLHLVLATQKPSNSVSNEIEANTRFRICLRVASKSDSNEMLKRPEAAYLKGMGRCYVQVGNNEVFEQVQTSFSGATYAPGALRSDEEPRMLGDAGQPLKFKKKKKQESGAKETTELSAALAHIIDCCKRYHFEPAKKLWLDELKEVILLGDLPEVKARSFDGKAWPGVEGGDLLALYGMADDINTQRYLPAILNLSQDRNVMVVGLSGSGKTTLLQTVAVSLALRYTPAQVVLYIFSLTSHALSCLQTLPHVGDIVYEEETDEQFRLIQMIYEESERRKKLFSKAATDNYVQYNLAVQDGHEGEKLPAIVVMVDRMQQVRDWGNGRNEDKLQLFYDLLRSGASQGIFFIITAFARNELMGKYQSFVRGISLRMNDRADYADALGVRVPPDWGGIRENPGRGMIARVDKEAKATFLYEIQTAVYGTAESDGARAKAIAGLGKQMRAAWQGALPRHLSRIPEEPALSALLAETGMPEAMERYDKLPLGYSKQKGEAFSVDLREAFTLLASGPKRSGKTNFIQQLAVEFTRKGAQVHVVGGAQLVAWAQERGIAAYAPGSEAWNAQFHSIYAGLIPERSKTLKEAGARRNEMLATFTPVVILIDDLDAYVTAYEQDNTMGNALKNFTADNVSGYGVYVYATISHAGFSRVRAKQPVAAFAASKRGIALCGKLSECDPFDTNIPYNMKNLTYPLGEGLLVSDQGAMHVVLPKCDL